MSKLKTNSSAGPDSLPPIFYRNARFSLTYPLSILLRIFIDLHELPNEWKLSIITPKFKSGSPSLPSNYRPIALTCTCCKILESIIAAELTDFLLSHNLISKAQHGFLKRHSTSTNLLESLNSWTLSLSNHKSVTIAYVDFQRAFDSISHAKLIHKLTSYGISGNLLLWIKAFLTGRTQSVRVGISISHPCLVTSGVPQGSVLGPILFNVFINDITDLFDPSSCSTKLFADDLKLYTEITDTNSATNFQSNLNLIFSWSLVWQIEISLTKSFIFNLATSRSPSAHQHFTFGNSILTSPQTIKDLGIIVDPQLKFNHQILVMVKKANQRAALIHRSFLSTNTNNLILAFKTYVRPLLEYASSVWNPSQINLINSIESVQKKFTKRLPGLSDCSYADRLRILNLQSLEHRRLQFDLVTCFNIIHRNTCLEPNDFFIFSTNDRSRGHPYRLIIPLAKSNIKRHSFSCRIIHPWNSLTSALVTNPNTQNFKNNLKHINLNKYLIHPSIPIT